MTEMVNVGTPKCMVCGNTGIVAVPKEGYDRWKAGEFVQVAFPTLDADQRELLMTGTHAHCWETITGGEEEEQFHDGGMRLLGDGWVQPDCECGWVGTATQDLDSAHKERAKHEDEA